MAMRPGRFACAGGIPAGETGFALNAGVLLSPDAGEVIRIQTWAEPYPPQ